MQGRISKAMFTVGCLVALCGGFAPPAHAQECSASQVSGKWAFWTNGNVNNIGPRVSAGIFTLDNSGSILHGKATSSLAGTVAPETFSGTYSVAPDCSGGFQITVFGASGNPLFTATLAIYVDDGGKEIRGIFTTVTAVLSSGGTAALLSEIVVEGRKIGEQ